jgi:O-glycosyl hydrolase
MLATVVQSWNTTQVLVTDNANGQQVLVNTNHNTSNLNPGDQVRIVFNGVMTASLPPQISAQSICVQRVY